MEPWKLKDGTVVELGGVVRGTSSLANRIRGDFEMLAGGSYVPSGYGPRPSVAPLDVSVPYLLDAYVRSSATVVSGPDVEYPERDDDDGSTEALIY